MLDKSKTNSKLYTCDHWKESNEDQRSASKAGLQKVSVDNHDQAANAVRSVQDGGDDGVHSKHVEEVVADVEGLGDVLEAFEIGGKTESGYAHKGIVDPSVGI